MPHSTDDWRDDEVLLAELRAALEEREQVSPRARQAARAAFTWRTVDEELLVLSLDSSLHDRVVVRRSAPARRVLSFRGSGVSLEVELDDGELMGVLTPGQPCPVTLLTSDGTSLLAESDADGFFTMPGVPRGRARFQVTVDARVLVTEWVDL